DRIEAINTLNIAPANRSLVDAGQANLRQSAAPLGYGIGRDGASLRIESRFGGQDIDDSFPQ
ncbi:MAG: hypothetical protein HC800_14705, partial [Phormidesmis sp. RL_2_1]|nr:hypothetical protein [Phormidesmis sp. RL_2_1]